MSGSGWEALTGVRDALPDLREWSGVLHRIPGEVCRPFPMSGCGREALLEIGSCREAIPEVRDWSGGHPGRPGGIERPSRKSESGRGASRKSGRGLEALPNVR